MNRRQLITRGLIGPSAVVLGWLGYRRQHGTPIIVKSPNDRVIFVCCDDHGACSPGVYLHGPDGGGPACLKFAREAAHCMRANEVGDSAAGLCGHLFTQFGAGVTSGGGISLYDSPRPGPDGKVDWRSYCSENVDLILVNVQQRIAECYVSPIDPKILKDSLRGKITDLKFGG